MSEQNGPAVDYGEPSAGVGALVFDTDELEAALGISPPTDDQLLSGVQKVYSTAEVADFFPAKEDGKNKSIQWVYWGMRTKDRNGNEITPVFSYPDGTPIEPIKVGKGGRRRFTLPIIRDIALACYYRGNLKLPELREVIRRILLAEAGEESFSRSA